MKKPETFEEQLELCMHRLAQEEEAETIRKKLEEEAAKSIPAVAAKILGIPLEKIVECEEFGTSIYVLHENGFGSFTIDALEHK